MLYLFTCRVKASIDVTFICLCLASSFYRLIFGLPFYLSVFGHLRLYSCVWSPFFTYLSLVFFLYVLVFGIILSTCIWSPSCTYLSFVSSFYVLMFGLLHLSIYLWSPPFIYLCSVFYWFLISYLYLLISGLLCLLDFSPSSLPVPSSSAHFHPSPLSALTHCSLCSVPLQTSLWNIIIHGQVFGQPSVMVLPVYKATVYKATNTSSVLLLCTKS